MSEPETVWRAWHSVPAALGREAPWFIAEGKVYDVNGTTMVLDTDTGMMVPMASMLWRRSRAAAIRDAARAIDRASKGLARQAAELRALAETAADDTDGLSRLGGGELDEIASMARAEREGPA